MRVKSITDSNIKSFPKSIQEVLIKIWKKKNNREMYYSPDGSGALTTFLAIGTITGIFLLSFGSQMLSDAEYFKSNAKTITTSVANEIDAPTSIEQTDSTAVFTHP